MIATLWVGGGTCGMQVERLAAKNPGGSNCWRDPMARHAVKTRWHFVLRLHFLL